MENKIKDGGPAFPSTNEIQCGDSFTGGHPGMSLRDYFAAKAMQATMTNKYFALMKPGEVAEVAYKAADAMLEAREASNG